MCVISMVHDYYNPLFAPLVPYVPEDLDKLLEDFKTAEAAAKVVDELTGQPDCVDPEKAKLSERVAELEQQLANAKCTQKIIWALSINGYVVTTVAEATKEGAMLFAQNLNKNLLGKYDVVGPFVLQETV